MTSTNDGKDVKSNQTSGHKGKSYYIELYKSLEKALNGESSIEARTQHVCEAWRRVYSLYQHSAPSTHPHLLSWLQRHTAHTVLQSKWAESKNEHARLTAAIDALVAEATAASAGREPHPWEQLLLQRAAWFRKTLGNPWGHPVLKSLINPNGDPVTDQQVLEWVIEERGIVLVTRLRQLASAGNCDDLALLLASAVMDRARAACPPRADHAADDKVDEEEDSTSFVAVLERDASFTVDVWELLTDIELVLLLKTDKRPRCIELAKLAPLRHGYAMVERLRNRLATSPRDKKLWKHAKEVATIVTQVIIARCMVLTTCSGVGRAALYCCARSLARLVPTGRLPAVSNTLATPAHTARHLHTFCAALHAQCSEEMKPFICELYVRAITAGMNELEQLKLNADKATETRAMEQTLASWFTQLGELLAGSARLRAECALTAFSVHPARAHYERVAATPPPAPIAQPQDPTPDTKDSSSDFGSWANDSRTQSNLVKTSETLQLKKTDQHQANVLSIAILTEGETLGLETELCQDLAVLLSGPRVKTLSWDMDRDVLLENCRVYMERTDGGTRAVTTELKYLNLDPAAYRHLPEEGDDEGDLYYGIEKGYEHEVQFEDPEEIWQNAFFDPEQTESANDSEVEEAIKKKVRAPVHSSEDDEDPLSTIADAKKEKKKLAKEKKERRRQKSHKRDTSKDGKRERRKDKEKKTKKESKKDKSEQTTGSLTSLLGMKVTKIPSQVPDGQKKVRKKKERRRDSMFSYVSVTDSDFDGQVKSPISNSDPNIVVDGIFSMDELKSPERRQSDDGQKPIDNTTTTLAKSDTVQSPVIKDIKPRTVVSSRVTTSSDSDTSRAKSPYLTPNQRGNKHVISKKVKSSIMTKLLKFRWSRPQARPPPRVPVPSPSPAPTQVGDAKQIPNQALVGMKIYNPEEIPKVYTNKKQNVEATKNEMNNLVNTPHSVTSDIANHTPKIPYNGLPAEKLQSSQNLFNVQKPSRQYSNVTRDIIQSVFNESYQNSEYLQQSAIKRVQQSICGTSQVPSVIHTNYTSPTKSDMKPHVLTPPKPIMAHQPFHKSMQNLSTDKIKHDVPKKPLLINDPNYFNQQHSKTASQVSPRIISNTCIKPPSQTAINTQQYDVNVIKEDLIKSSQRHTEIKRINMAKAAENLSNQIANLKSDLIKYEQKKLSSSMQNVNAASGSCNNVKRHIFTPSDMLHGNSSQSKIYSGKPDNSYTLPVCHSNKSSSASRCIPIQDMKSRQNAQTPKTVTGLNSHYQDFLKELAKTINAGSKDPGKNVTIALNKEVKVTPVIHPPVSSKKPNALTPQCAKQTIHQKKPENAPNTFSRLSYMHKNKLNENKVNINDALNMELNKNILEHKMCKAKYFNNEVTISRVGATQANIQDQKNFIRKNEQTSLKLQKSCPILTGMLDSPVKTSQTTIQSSSDNQTDRDHADLLLLLRNQPVMKSNPKISLTLTSTSDSTITQTFSNTPTKVDTGMHHTLVGTKVKNIHAILEDTPAVNQECMSENNKPKEWEQVMNDIKALKTEPLGPNALDMVLKKDYKRQSLSNSRPHTSQKSKKVTGHSTPKNKPSESKRREHSTSISTSSSRKPSTEKHSEILKSHRKTEIIKKPSSTESQKTLEGHSKHYNSNTSKTDDPFISGIPNSAYDMLGDLMDDDLRQELGELSSDEEAYNAPNVPVTKVKHNTNIPKTSTACNVPNVAKEEPHIVAPKTVVCMNESTSNLICRTITNTHSTVGYTNVIASNTSHIDAARLAESRPTVVCSNPENAHTAAVITNQIIQHTANNFITNHNNIDPSCFMGSIEPSNVIIASVPLPVPAQPVVVIRQDLVYDPYPTIHIHETQVTAGLCNVNQNVYTINNTPNIAVYQTTQFAAPVINPVIIGSAMTTTNVSNSVAMAEPQMAPDTTNVDVNTQEPDSTNLAITDRLVEDDSNPEVKSTNLDFNMNRNCERKVLSQVQEKHPTENVDNDFVVRRLSADDELVKTKQDEERIKLKRQTLMNRKISHACFHPPIPLAYTPLSKNVNFGKLLQQDTLKNGTVRPNQKVLPNTANGISKYVSVTTSDKDVGANNENIKSTEQSSSAKENQKTCRRISLRSSKISDSKLSPDKQAKIRLNRNKIKLKISDTFIEKITNIENENKESVKPPTRISSRILNKKKLNASDSNKPLSSTETQNYIANNELIDFEEELSGSKILKTTLPTSGEVMKKESECENNKPSDISINEHGKSECKIEDVPSFESKKLIHNSLEPTVVIEKLKNHLGDQLITSLPAKTPAKEPKDETIKIVNRTLRSKIISKDLLSVTVKDAPKNAGSEKTDLSIPLENADRVPIASPIVIHDKTIMKSTIVLEQKVIKQTETTDLASKQTHGTDLPPCNRVMHELEAENNRAPALRISRAPLNVKESLPASETLANKVVTHIDTSRTMVQNMSSVPSDETQSNQARKTEHTVPLQPQLNILNMNPPLTERNEKVAVQNKPFNDTEIISASKILPNKPTINEVNTVIQNLPSLPKDNSLKVNNTDPKKPVPMHPLLKINTKPTEIEQEVQDIVEQTPQTSNDTKSIPTAKIVLSSTDSSLLHKTEKLDKVDPKVTTPLHEVMPKATSLTQDKNEEVKETDFKSTVSLLSSTSLPVEMAPKLVNIDANPPGTHKTLSALETVSTNVNPKDGHTMVRKEVRVPIAQKDLQQVVKQLEFNSLQKTEDTNPDSVLKMNSPGDIKQKDEQITSDPVKSLLCDKNTIEIPDDDTLTQSNANHCKRDEQEKTAMKNDNTIKMNESTSHYVQKKDAPITGNKKQEGTRIIMKGDIKLEELPVVGGQDSDTKLVRITLPNGKVFKATIFGNIQGDFDTLFSDPTMKSLLAGGIKDGRRYTLNYKQISKASKNDPSKILDTKIQGMNIKEADLPVDTINLISDDEEEIEFRSFITEFGKYRTNVDQETYTKHQEKFDQKCVVKLFRENIFKSNKTKPKRFPSLNTSLLTRTKSKFLSDVASVSEVSTEILSKTENNLPAVTIDSTDKTATKQETLQIPLLEIASELDTVKIPDVIEIDDSSNDSVDDLATKSGKIENVEPVEKIIELKNLLLQDLGVEALTDTEKNITLPVKNKPAVDDLKNALLQDLGVVTEDSPIIDITENDEEDDNVNAENAIPNITSNGKDKKPSEIQMQDIIKDCVIRIAKCESLIKRYELMKTMKKCYVKLERLNDSVLDMSRLELNDESNNEETCESNQENGEEFIEFDVEDTFSSPQLSRYPSLSILNSWDDVGQPVPDSPCCSSPVMEIYDTIVQLRTTVTKTTELLFGPHNNSFSCDSEWRLTKSKCRTPEILKLSFRPETEDKEYTAILSHCDSIVNDNHEVPLTFKSPKLSTIILKFLEDNPDVIHKLKFMREMSTVPKSNSPSNKLKRKTEGVKNTVASKILKLGTLALNTFNSCIAVAIPAPSSEQGIVINPIDKCILIEVVNKQEVMPSGSEKLKTEDIHVFTPEKVEKIVDSIDIESDQSNKSDKSEMDLTGRRECSEDIFNSSYGSELVDEETDTSSKETCNDIYANKTSPVYIGTEALCTNKTGSITQVPTDVNNLFSSACVVHFNTTNVEIDMATCDCEKVSVHENTNIPDDAIKNELMDHRTENKEEKEVDCNESDRFAKTYVNSPTQDQPVNNQMESHLIERNEALQPDDVTNVVRVVVEDVLDKISQTDINEKLCTYNNVLQSPDGEIHSKNQDGSNLYAIKVCDTTKDGSEGSMNIKETTPLNSATLTNAEETPDTHNDILQLEGKKLNTNTIAEAKTTIKTDSKVIEPLTIKESNECTSKGQDFQTENTEDSKDGDKETSLQSKTSYAETSNQETQMSSDSRHECNEMEVSNIFNMDDIERYEIPIEHLLLNKIYEVEIIDTPFEDADSDAISAETLCESRPELVTCNNENLLEEMQSNNSEIKSPVLIDSKEIAFNYHDYTKRPKQKQNTTIDSANEEYGDECYETHDRNSINEKNAPNNSRQNGHPSLNLNLKCNQCPEKASTEASKIEVNSLNENYSLKSDTKCKYELIQDDDWLTVIKTENGKDDDYGSVKFVGTNDVIKEKPIVASLCSKNTTINIKGFEYDDVYIFPLSESGSNTSSDSLGQELNSDVLKSDNLQDDIHDIDYSVVAPKVTYSRKCLKRKIDMRDSKVANKKYRKGKNIDCPKLTVTSMAESAYSKEYKLLLEYCSSVKFSYSRPFHKECVEVDDLTNNWPINITFNDVPGDVTDEHLFTNCQKTDRFQPDPTTQTLAEEISFQYENSDTAQRNPPNEASEENFNMGFGEGSGRVIQILKKGGESNISAATLSDVKQSQPVFKSVDLHDINDLKTNSDDQIKKICQHLNFLELRDKVRSFFKKSSVELKSDWLQEKIKDADFKSRFHADEFPFDFCSLNYVKPVPTEAIVQVVQVGQLPVSAAAQNPVTCDPRVTQVSNASPSQCSVDNSPNDDSQSEIKTEYTELTTADLTIPLQEYAQQNQASMNLASHDTNIELTEQTISLEMEIKAEESLEIKEEMPDIKEERSNSSDTELHTLTNATPGNENYSFEHNTEKSDARSVIYDSSEQNSSETFSLQRQQNGTSEKTDQIAHAMNAAGITTSPETITNTRAHALVNILSQKIRQGSVNNTQTATNTYSKTTSINAMALQQALAQILPPPLNQTGSSDNNQTQSTPVGPQVLHIVQGKNASGNQITLVDNSQQSVISTPNATQVLHIVQNKTATSGQASNGTLTPQSNSFSGLSLVDAGLQQGGNQLLHIVNTGNQKTASPGQLLKRVNLLTNLTNVQGSNEQKMVQFVCKSADGKAIQLNAPHQRSMVLRLQPIETPNVQTPPAKPAESQELSPSTTSSAANKDSASQQEIKSRSIYEENYAKFIQNSSSKTPGLEKSTSLPKFNQAFGKPVFQEGSQKQSDAANNNSHLPPVNTNTENSECTVTEHAINLEHIGQISSPPLLLRKQPAVTTQSQPNIVQQIKQTIAPMNIQTMHGGVIYTRQIPVNIGGGQTINLITVPSTELINEETPKPQTQTSQGDIEPSIIKIVPQSQTNTNTESTQEESNNHASGSNENTPTPQPQPVLTQMRIKLPMLSKTPQMVPGARVVRPSFFQIQRNVIGGANQPVYQQLVLTAAPPLGQQTIRLPQAQTSRPMKVPSENQSSSSESQMSSSTLEQLREFDMVLEQVKERSTVQPITNSTNNSSFKIHTSSSDTTDGNASSNCSTESTSQVLYSIGNNQSLNVAYVSRKTTVTTPTTSTYVRSPDSSGIADSPSSSTHVHLSHTVTSDSSPTEMSSQSKPAKVGSKSKSRPKSTSNPPNTLKLNSVPPKTSSQKPLEDEQTTQRILYILAEYKEQVENSPDKDKPAPRRRSNPPSNPGSSKRKKSSSSRRSGTREMSPVHGEDTCRTMGSEDSSCGTSQGDCNESCLDSHSPQDSPRKVARKITFDQDLTVTQPRPQAQRNVIVADGQTITVARGTTGKPATAVLMPANYILPVSMVKGGQQIAIVTNRGPKLLTVGGEGGATNALLLQRLIGPAGLKPVLARPGVRHVRLPTAALHNLQAFNLATATTVQPPDSTASPTSGPTPPELSDTRANSSPWTDREDVKPERGSSPEGSEPWNLPSSADAHEYTYEETVRTDNMDRTVLDPIPDRYSPDMEAQRIFDKMFDVDSKKSYAVDSQDNSPRCAYDIDPSDCDDKPYQVVQKKDGSQRQHRLSHVSAAALRHKYAILEHELRLQKSLSEECEDLGVDSPSASELFPEAELLFAASPAHEHNHDAHHSHTPQPHQSSTIPQPDMDDQIATDHLIPREIDVSLGLGDVGIVAVSDDGMQATIALDQEEFARSHPNTTFHSEPTEGEIQPFTITGLKGRHITSTIFHSNSAPATVLMAAPQATVISQAPDHGVKYEIENMMNSMPSSHNNDMNLSSVLVKDDGLTRFDSILTDSRELHLTNTASAIVHSSGNATQVIRRVCYEDDKRERDARYLIDEPDNLIAGDDAKMIAEDSSRDATLESMADVDDDRSSPERHAELFWESNSASERSESRRPLDFSSDSDKCCKSPSYDETNSTDSSGVGTRMRLDSVIKEARGRERSGSADGSSADDTHPPLRTYPPKRLYHPEGEVERSLSGKTRAGERSPDSLEVRRRASGRGVVKRGCHCCNGSPAPPRPKKPRQRKPTLDFNTNT